MVTKTKTDVLFHEQRYKQGDTTYSQRVRLENTRTSDGLKDYASKIRDKLDATTALTAKSESIRSAVNLSFTATRGTASLYREMPPPLSLPIVDLTTVTENMRKEAVARARTSMNSYVDNALSPFNAQVFTGELRETINFLRSPFESLLELAEALLVTIFKVKASGRIKGKRYIEQTIANAWLEFRFAALPLFSDIDAIVDIANGKMKDVLDGRKKFYGYSERSVSSYTNQLTGVNDVQYKLIQETRYRAQCYIHCGINFAILNDEIRLDSAAFDQLLSIENLPSTAWELTPFSWLVDYFINVGAILSAPVQSVGVISYASESLVLTGETTSLMPREQVFLNVPWSYYTGLKVGQSGGSITKRRLLTRSTGIKTIPPLYFSLPGSGVRLANIAALLVSLNFRR